MEKRKIKLSRLGIILPCSVVTAVRVFPLGVFLCNRKGTFPKRGVFAFGEDKTILAHFPKDFLFPTSPCPHGLHGFFIGPVGNKQATLSFVPSLAC